MLLTDMILPLELNADKVACHELNPPKAIEQIVRFFTFGAEKIQPNSQWRLQLNWSYLYQNILDHLHQWKTGSNIDTDSQSHHLAIVAWNALLLLEYERTKRLAAREPLIEKWLPVPDYGNYSVSNYGRLRNHKTNRMLKPSDNGNGYLTLGANRGRKRLYIHRIVAELFIRKPLPKEFVNHRDGNRANNIVTNLEYVTASGNLLHAGRTGTRRVTKQRNKLWGTPFQKKRTA